MMMIQLILILIEKNGKYLEEKDWIGESKENNFEQDKSETDERDQG